MAAGEKSPHPVTMPGPSAAGIFVKFITCVCDEDYRASLEIGLA